MYSLIYIVVSIVIFALLVQINLIVGLFFFVLAAVSLPATVIHRREAHVAPEIGPDAESRGQGIMHLIRVVGMDTSGIALGVLLLILIALLARVFAFH